MTDVTERYTSACTATNLRVSAEKPGAADVLIAAGWSKHQLGAALMRLRSEWDSVAKPRRVTPEAITQVARTMQGTPTEKLQKAQKIASDWYTHELRLLAQRLQTLPAIRRAITAQAGNSDIASGRARVGGHAESTGQPSGHAGTGHVRRGGAMKCFTIGRWINERGVPTAAIRIIEITAIDFFKGENDVNKDTRPGNQTLRPRLEHPSGQGPNLV